MYTTTSLFLKTLAQYGITHAFVNWGSDHPAFLEDLERQRVTTGKTCLEIITCPNEMVALSAAQGYAQVTGRPAAVLVHVDVGTQALAGAVHNVDRCRVPVLIYAGASPFSCEGELKGSRNEFIMWLQDIPDQASIVRQYMRFTAQINNGSTVRQSVLRALQFATSDPKGPVYLWARREPMEEPVSKEEFEKDWEANRISAVEPRALSSSGTFVRPITRQKQLTACEKAVDVILDALISAESPLIVTSYLGRNPTAVQKLVELSELLVIPVFQSCPSTVNFPSSHPHYVGLSFGIGENSWLRSADVILIIDSDIPFIPVHNKPRPGARVFHIDVDVLKKGMGAFNIDAEMRCEVDSDLALSQLLESLSSKVRQGLSPSTEERASIRKHLLTENQVTRTHALNEAEQTLPADGSFTVPNLLSVLRESLPKNTLVLNEGISNYPLVWDHMRPDVPGSVISSAASSLGWGLGAAIGAYLGNKVQGSKHDLIVLVVGDGSFLFGVPSSAFWIARRYKTPFLTIVLNNGGWKSPKLSMLGVYPNGLGSKVPGAQLTVGFGPEAPDYSQIAVAAGGAWGKRVNNSAELRGTFSEAINIVLKEGRSAVVDCVLESI